MKMNMKEVRVVKQPSGKISSTIEAFGRALLKMAGRGGQFAFITSDNVGRDSSLGRLMQQYPERCFDVGIAEGNQVGVAAGLALGGEQPVYCKGFGIFLTLRAADQIHVDIGYNHVPVRMLADHCGITAAGGPTHNMVTDLALMRAIPGITIVSPADAVEAAKQVELSLHYKEPMYLRFTKGIDPVIYQDDQYELEIGKAIRMREGQDVTLIGMGQTVGWCLQAANILADWGKTARVINMHTLKPMDQESVLNAAAQTGAIVTVEDHGAIGGLGSAVAQALMEGGVSARLKVMGFPDIYMPPETIANTYERYGLTPQNIARQARLLTEQEDVCLSGMKD